MVLGPKMPSEKMTLAKCFGWPSIGWSLKPDVAKGNFVTLQRQAKCWHQAYQNGDLDFGLTTPCAASEVAAHRWLL
jgi:hypothetical protein